MHVTALHKDGFWYRCKRKSLGYRYTTITGWPQAGFLQDIIVMMIMSIVFLILGGRRRGIPPPQQHSFCVQFRLLFSKNLILTGKPKIWVSEAFTQIVLPWSPNYTGTSYLSFLWTWTCQFVALKCSFTALWDMHMTQHWPNCCTWLTQQPRLQTFSKHWCPTWVLLWVPAPLADGYTMQDHMHLGCYKDCL